MDINVITNPKKLQTLFFRTPNQDKIKTIFDKYGNNPNVMFNLGIKVGENSYHAISVHSYNPETQIFKIVDPDKLGVYEEKTLDELAPNIVKLWATNI